MFDVLSGVTVSRKKRCETVISVECQPAEGEQLPRFIDNSLGPEVHETVVTPTQTLFKSTPIKSLPEPKSPEPLNLTVLVLYHKLIPPQNRSLQWIILSNQKI